MRRREFITLLGGAAAAWPLAARAQQPAMPVIGFLDARSLDDVRERLRAFRQGLKRHRLYRGRERDHQLSLRRESVDRLPALAAKLVRRQVAVIATSGQRVALADQGGNHDDSIVLHRQPDPVKLGLVVSVARPGGNRPVSISSRANCWRSGWNCCVK